MRLIGILQPGTLLFKEEGDLKMTPKEAQQALNQHAPCTYYSPKASGGLDAKIVYDVEVIRVDADPIHPRIIVGSADRPGLEIAIAREDFNLLQLTSHMEEEFIEVEYDTTYAGGDYSDVGDFAYIPARLVDEIGM